MLRGCRALASSRGRRFSTKPPTPPSGKPAAGNPSKPTIQKQQKKGGYFFTTSLVLVTAGVGYIAYQMEEDSKFAAKVESNIPDFVQYLDPVRGLIRQSGLITKPSATSLPASTSPSQKPAPAPTPVPEAAKPTTSGSKPTTIAPVQTVSETKVTEKKEEKTKPETSVVANEKKPEVVVKDEAAKAAPAAAAPVPQTKAETPLVVSAVESTPILPEVTEAEMKARKLRLEAAAEIYDELSLQAVALRKELELTLLKDLDKLDAAALRVRVTQMAGEFFERTKWESLRLHQALRQVETDVSRKYLELMNQQRAELEVEMNRAIGKKEESLTERFVALEKVSQARHDDELTRSLHLQAEELKEHYAKDLEAKVEEIRSGLEDHMNHDRAILTEQYNKELMELQAKYESLKAELIAFHAVIDSTEERTRAGVLQHKSSAALLALEEALRASRPFSKELKAVTANASEDALVKAVVEAIPPALSASGAPSLAELQARFGVVRKEIRKATFAPPAAPTLIGQMIGSAAAMIYPAPKGNVTGQGTDEALARAAYQLDKGHLADALTELEGLQGYSKVLLKDWTAQVQSRMLADQSAQILRANNIVRHSSF